MTLYEAKQYLHYLWKAKGRHGTHSPFVYGFVEDLMQPSGNDAALMNNLPAYFRFKAVSEYTMTPQGMAENNLNIAEDSQQKHATLPFNKLYIINTNPAPGKPFIDQLLATIQPGDALLLKPIHLTEQHNAQWNQLKDDARVRLSMDLFGMGMLFFKKEFQVKQHFVLKY